MYKFPAYLRFPEDFAPFVCKSRYTKRNTDSKGMISRERIVRRNQFFLGIYNLAVSVGTFFALAKGLESLVGK